MFYFDKKLIKFKRKTSISKGEANRGVREREQTFADRTYTPEIFVRHIELSYISTGKSIPGCEPINTVSEYCPNRRYCSIVKKKRFVILHSFIMYRAVITNAI